MAVETELKLRIAPEDMARLKRNPLLRKLTRSTARVQKLHNTYYDTPRLDLLRSGMALRLRRVGGRWMQTLKGGGGVEAGLHSRNEWETPVAKEALDLDALKAVGARLPPGVKKKLRPVFRTDFTRSVRMVEFEGATVELCMDSGVILSGGKERQISELELELKSGEAGQLFELALALLESVPLQAEMASKAEYGYRMFAGGKKTAVKAAPLRLEPNLGVAAALRTMVTGCLVQVQSNLAGATGTQEEEFLHQLRVGLRRLRVALALAHAYRPDAALSGLRRETGDWCKEMGATRDWDVFVSRMLEPLCASNPEDAGLRRLLHSCEKTRSARRAELQARLASEDFQRHLLRIGAWLHSAYWQGVQGGAAELEDFAGRVLKKRGKQAERRGREWQRARAGRADMALHALRIACKKLRYSVEMFASLYRAGRSRRYLAALSALQDTLGTLNDITTARRILAELEGKAGPVALETVDAWLDHARAGIQAEIESGWNRFARTHGFRAG